MTGFGREEKLINDKKIVIEIRTLNSKGLDINLKVHDSFSFIGEYLRKSVKEKLIKGKVDIILDIEDTNEDLLLPFNKSKIKASLSMFFILVTFDVTQFDRSWLKPLAV